MSSGAQMSMTLEEVRSENVEGRIAREKRRERKKMKRKQTMLREREELNPERGEGGGGRERIRPGRYV